MGYQVITRNTKFKGVTGSGPQVLFSNDLGDDVYLIIGSWDNVNNIVSGTKGRRPLVIKLTGGLRIEGLKAAPAGAQTTNLVVDEKGNIYKQS